MNVLVDTGVFSAARADVPPAPYTDVVEQLVGHRLLLATVTIAELRYGALNAGWSSARKNRLEEDLREKVTVVPVSDALIRAVAVLRHECRQAGHALHQPAHANDLWIAASAIHIDAPLATVDGVFVGVPGLRLLVDEDQAAEPVPAVVPSNRGYAAARAVNVRMKIDRQDVVITVRNQGVEEVSVRGLISTDETVGGTERQRLAPGKRVAWRSVLEYGVPDSKVHAGVVVDAAGDQPWFIDARTRIAFPLRETDVVSRFLGGSWPALEEYLRVERESAGPDEP